MSNARPREGNHEMTGFTSVMTRPKRSAGGGRNSRFRRLPPGGLSARTVLRGRLYHLHGTVGRRGGQPSPSTPQKSGWRTDGQAPALPSPKDTIFDSIQSTLEKG